MISRHLATLVLFLCALAPLGASHAASPVPNKAAIEKIVREYLLAHPEVIEEAQAVLQKKQAEIKAAQARKMLQTEKSALYGNAAAPVAGNAQGDVTVIEFFDYRCGYCKRASGALNALLARDPKARVVLKEYPILGPESVYAAKAALAAQKQGKYLPFHSMLMAVEWSSEQEVLELAGKNGIDVERLKADMGDPAVQAHIEENYRLGAALEVNGTPAFIIGDRIIPGALDAESLISMVQEERAKLTAKPVAKAAKK